MPRGRDHADSLCAEVQCASRCGGRRQVRDWLGGGGGRRATPKPARRFPLRRSATATPAPTRIGSPSTATSRERMRPRATARGHRDAPPERGEFFTSCGRFCKRCRELTVRKRVAGSASHEAGRTMEADWIGPAMGLVDPARGRGIEGLPVRDSSSSQPPVSRRTDAGHEAGHSATLPSPRTSRRTP